MLGFRISVGNVIAMAVTFVIALWALFLLYGDWWAWMVFALCSFVSLSCVLTVRGATVWEWLYRRLTVKKVVTRNEVVSVNGRAAVWDKKTGTMSMYVEVFGSPWEVSRVASNADLECSTIPMESLIGLLRQFGITLKHIRVIGYGYKTSTDDRAAVAVDGVVGTIPYLLGGRTFLEVSLRMGDNWNAVYARMPHDKDTVSDGLMRSVSIAADRILRVFENYNIPSRIMSQASVKSITNEILRSLGSPLTHPTWSFDGIPGDGGVGAAVTFTPTSFNSSTRRTMGEVVSRRQFYCTTLSSGSDTNRVNQSVTYLADGIGAMDLLTGQGLRRENGHHTARISHLLPLGRDIAVDDDGVTATEIALKSLVIPTHGLGIYLGQDRDRSRVFIHPGRGGEALWIIGNDTLARRLALRASTQDLRVATCLNTDDWYHLVTTRKSRTLVREDNPSTSLFTTDLLFCTPDQFITLGEHVGNDAAAIIVVTDEFPPITPQAFIVAHETDPDVAVLLNGNTTHEFVLDAPPNERTWIEP